MLSQEWNAGMRQRALAFDLVADYPGSGEPIIEGPIREIHRCMVRGVRGLGGLFIDPVSKVVPNTVVTNNLITHHLRGRVTSTRRPAQRPSECASELATFEE